MPKPIRRSDRQNRDYLRRFFASRRGQDILREEDVPVGDINLLPEAPVYGTPTQYQEADLAKAGLLALREGAGMVPIVGEALDVAEFDKIRKTGKDFYEDEADPTVYAGVTAGGLLLPNLIERPAKFVGRMGKKFFKFGKKAAEATPTKTASVITDTDTSPLPIYKPSDRVTQGLPTLKDQSGTQFVRDWYTRPEVRQHFRDVSGSKPPVAGYGSSKALSEAAYGDFVEASNRQLDFVEIGDTGNYKVVSNDPVISDLADKLNNIKPGDPSRASKVAEINKQIDSRRAELNESLIKDLEEKYGKEIIDPMRMEGGNLLPLREDPSKALEDVFYRGRTAPDMLADYMTNPRVVPENAGGVMIPGDGFHKGLSALKVLDEEGQEVLAHQARIEWLKSASAHESNHFANYSFISSSNPLAEEIREGMASAVKPELRNHVRSGDYGAAEGLETGVYGLQYYGSASELTARAMEMRRNVFNGTKNIASNPPSSLSPDEKKVLEAFNGKPPTEQQALDFALGKQGGLTSAQEEALTDMAIKRGALPKGSLLHVYNNVLDGGAGTKEKRDAVKNLMKFSLATGVAATAYGSMEGESQPSSGMAQGGMISMKKKPTGMSAIRK